jgi:hypothetical protein
VTARSPSPRASHPIRTDALTDSDTLDIGAHPTHLITRRYYPNSLKTRCTLKVVGWHHLHLFTDVGAGRFGEGASDCGTFGPWLSVSAIMAAQF